DFKSGVLPQALLNRRTPLLDVLRWRVRIHSGKADSCLSEHGLAEVELIGKERGRWGEVVALLGLRKHIRNVVALIAPGIHVHRRLHEFVTQSHFNGGGAGYPEAVLRETCRIPLSQLHLRNACLTLLYGGQSEQKARES